MTAASLRAALVAQYAALRHIELEILPRRRGFAAWRDAQCDRCDTRNEAGQARRLPRKPTWLHWCKKGRCFTYAELSDGSSTIAHQPFPWSPVRVAPKQPGCSYRFGASLLIPGSVLRNETANTLSESPWRRSQLCARRRGALDGAQSGRNRTPRNLFVSLRLWPGDLRPPFELTGVRTTRSSRASPIREPVPPKLAP